MNEKEEIEKLEEELEIIPKKRAVKPRIALYNSIIAIALRMLYNNKPLVFTTKDYTGNFADVLVLAQELNQLLPEINCSDISCKFGVRPINRVEFSLPEIRKPYLLKYLSEYMELYTSNKLRSDTKNLPTWHTQQVDFIRFVSDTYTDNCIIKDIEYMHVLLHGIIAKLIQIKSINIGFDNNKILEFAGKPDIAWNDDFIKINIRADITQYIEEYRNTKPSKPMTLKKPKLEDIPTLKLFLECALRKLKKGEFCVSSMELNELRVRPQRKYVKPNFDKIATNVSNRISKIRPAFKALSNSNNELFEADIGFDKHFSGNYNIVASEEMIQAVLEKIRVDGLG